MTLLCHHNDQDGQCSAFWVLKYVDSKARCAEMGYDKSFPLELVAKDEEVWIVDLSIKPKEMEALLEKTEDVYWIDHHKTAIDDYKDFPHKLRGLRFSGVAACELTWLYTKFLINKNNGFPDPSVSVPDLLEKSQTTPPMFTRLVGDRDVWKFALGRDSSLFFLGLGTYPTAPGAPIWDKLAVYPELYKKLIEEGTTVEKYRNIWAKSYRERFAFEVEFEGYRALAMGIGQCGSEYFVGADTEYDILIPFVYDGEKWQFSLYTIKTDKINVGLIAKEKYGGGGHVGAAGFVTKERPSWLKRKG